MATYSVASKDYELVEKLVALTAIERADSSEYLLGTKKDASLAVERADKWGYKRVSPKGSYEVAKWAVHWDA